MRGNRREQGIFPGGGQQRWQEIQLHPDVVVQAEHPGVAHRGQAGVDRCGKTLVLLEGHHLHGREVSFQNRDGFIPAGIVHHHHLVVAFHAVESSEEIRKKPRKE